MNSTSDCTRVTASVLIAHPCASVADRMAEEFKGQGWFPLRCTSGKALRSVLEKTSPSLLVTELRLSDGFCLPLLKQITQDYPSLLVVIVTGHDSAASAVELHRCGIDLYMQRGTLAADILTVLQLRSVPVAEAFHPHRLADRLDERAPTSHLNRLCWEYINRVVSYAGSISQAAALMGLDRRSLRRMLSNYAPPGG